MYKKDGRNLPNRITEARLVLSIVVFFLMVFSQGNLVLQWVSFSFFLLVISTDSLDGYLARKFNQVTEFGKALDPTVDKVLMASVLVPSFFIYKDFQWLIAAIVACELVVSIISSIKRNPVNWLGKIRMISQCIAVSFLLLPIDNLFLIKKIFFIIALLANLSSMISHLFRGFKKKAQK